MIAGLQMLLAFGALALGQPAIAGVFGVFALVQLISVFGQRCVPGGACESRLVAPGPARSRGDGDRR